MFSLQPVQREGSHWQSELDIAIKAVKAKKNILVVGHSRLGKTSFLLSLSDKISSLKSYVPMMLSAEKNMSLESYIRINLLNILNAFKDHLGGNPSELYSLSMLDVDKRVSELGLSDDLKYSLKLLLIFENDPKIKMEDVLKHFAALPSLLAREAKKVAVMLVDDANFLSGIKSGDLSAAHILENMNAPESTFVLTASYRFKLEGVEEISLKRMTLESLRQFLSDECLELDEAALNTLFNVTSGHPFYVNFFARVLKTSEKRDSSAINALVEDALLNELDVYFSERLNLLSPRELPILFCMAEHKVNTPSRVSKLLDYSQTNVRRFLSIMEEKGFVLLKERGVFEIYDPVFRRWLEQPRNIMNKR